jgi:heterodisulfide reductase subunit C2
MSAGAAAEPDLAFLDLVEAHSGQKVSRCFQCRKCTNGCSLAFAMDVMPNQVVRMIQLGLRDEALRSRAIWVCAGCQTCTTRCPNDVDLARLMDSLRQLGRRSGVPAADARVLAFHEALLDSIRRHGRVFELGMLARYKLASGDLLGDAGLAWRMLAKGKLKLLPEGVRDKAAVRRIFAEREE